MFFILKQERMSLTRETQQTQEPTQRVSDRSIVEHVLGGDYGRTHGIGQKIKRSVFAGDIHSSQPSSSQSQPPPPHYNPQYEEDNRINREALRQMQEIIKTMVPPDMLATLQLVDLSPRPPPPPPTAPAPPTGDDTDDDAADLGG